MFAILFESNFVQKTNQWKLIVDEWLVLFPVATPMVTHPKALGLISTVKKFQLG